MKQILPLLFLLFAVSPSLALAAIDFQISNFERVNDYYSVDAIITGAATGSSYFIQSMFKRSDVSGYFGHTWSQKGEWISYLSDPNPDLIKTDFPMLISGQTQKFIIKPDVGSSKYIGPGEYQLRLKRYTGNSSGGEFSDNTLMVTLSDSKPTPDPSPSPTSTPSQSLAETITATTTPSTTLTPSPTRAPTATPTIAPTATPTLTTTPAQSPTQTTGNTQTKISPEESDVEIEASSSPVLVLGDSVSLSPTPTLSDQFLPRANNTVFKYTFIFGVIVVSLSGGLLYFRHKTD